MDFGHFLIVPELVAHQILAGSIGYFVQPASGRPNDLTVLGFTQYPTFDTTRGIFDETFTVTITSETPGARLVYTTDGSPPAQDSGTVVDPSEKDVPSSFL